MDDEGIWRMAPAYDLTQSVSSFHGHSTSVAGCSQNISRHDLIVVAQSAGISLSLANEIIDQVHEVVHHDQKYKKIAQTHCTHVF